MARKKRGWQRSWQNPPLSVLDGIIYAVLAVASVIAAPVLMAPVLDGWGSQVWQDPQVLACTRLGMGFVMPALVYLMATGPLFFGTCILMRLPIFGNRQIAYGEYPWPKDCFPLTDPRRKRTAAAPARRRAWRKAAAVWCAGLALCLLLSGLALPGRDCLRRDMTVVHRNLLGRETVYTPADFRELSIQVWLGGGRHVSYRYETAVRMEDGRWIRFASGAFPSEEDSLRGMVELKSLFDPADVGVIGANLADRLADQNGMTPTQRQLLYRLVGR